MSLLSVSNLSISFGDTTVVDNISFEINEGERVCIIGESGSGKSVTALAIDALLPVGATATGSIVFDGRQILDSSDRDMQRIRGNDIGFVFQEPQSALNPVLRVKKQLVAARREHRGLKRADAARVAAGLAAAVDLPEPERIINRFPHELSGGQRQRVVIAMAMSCQPKLLIADEPTTALDATVQARVLDLMTERTSSEGAALLMITHDMAVAAKVADRLIVMRGGKIVESGPTLGVLRNSTDPYTVSLVEAARATSLRRSA